MLRIDMAILCIMRYRSATDAKLNGHDAVPAATLILQNLMLRKVLYMSSA